MGSSGGEAANGCVASATLCATTGDGAPVAVVFCAGISGTGATGGAASVGSAVVPLEWGSGGLPTSADSFSICRSAEASPSWIGSAEGQSCTTPHITSLLTLAGHKEDMSPPKRSFQVTTLPLIRAVRRGEGEPGLCSSAPASSDDSRLLPSAVVGVRPPGVELLSPGDVARARRCRRLRRRRPPVFPTTPGSSSPSSSSSSSAPLPLQAASSRLLSSGDPSAASFRSLPSDSCRRVGDLGTAASGRAPGSAATFGSTSPAQVAMAGRDSRWLSSY